MSQRHYTRLTVVRPYDASIRAKVFACLEAAGLKPRQEDIIAQGVSDAEVIALLRRRQGHALLIPFHPHRDKDRRSVNGVTLYQTLCKGLPELQKTPVFMPVEKGMSSLVRKLVQLRGADTVLIIEEEELGRTDRVASRIRSHLRDHAPARSAH